MLFLKRRRQLKLLVINNMDVLYAVPWIEVEYGWGSKPDGYEIFADLEECIRSTKESSEKGKSTSGYYGPERPIHYYEIPKDSIDLTKVDINNAFFVDDVQFKSEPNFINNNGYDKSR